MKKVFLIAALALVGCEWPCTRCATLKQRWKTQCAQIGKELKDKNWNCKEDDNGCSKFVIASCDDIITGPETDDPYDPDGGYYEVTLSGQPTLPLPQDGSGPYTCEEMYSAVYSTCMARDPSNSPWLACTEDSAGFATAALSECD